MQIDRLDTFIASLGHEAYRVGGSVRDELIGRPSKDADYMIRNVPMDMLEQDLCAAAGNKAVSLLRLRDGRQAGFRVYAQGVGFAEIVLPRTDRPRKVRKGENAHRAFDIVVDPSVSLDEDAKRRDFTFNALYRDLTSGEVIDPTGRGLYDLERRIIHTTHEDSFRDDPLRTLRAVRFVARGFTLSTPAVEQMTKHAPFVTGLSANGYASGTVLDEMSKILMGDNAVDALRAARDTGVLAALFPELAPMLGFDQGSRYHDLTTDEHTFKALETAVHTDAPLRVRWALLFHDAGKPATAWVGKDGRKHYYLNKNDPDHPGDHEVVGERIWRGVAERISTDKHLREDVAVLIREHMVSTRNRNPGPRVRRARVKLGDSLLRDLYMHRMCDLSGKGKAVIADIQAVAELEKLRQEAKDAGVPVSVKDLQVSGHDVIEAGGTGKKIGEVLKSILDEVVVEPDEQRLSREWQLGRVGSLV